MISIEGEALALKVEMGTREVNAAALELVVDLDAALRQHQGISESEELPNSINLTHNGSQIDYSARDSVEDGEVWRALSLREVGNHIFLTGFKNPKKGKSGDVKIYTTTTGSNNHKAVEYVRSVIEFIKTPVR